MIWSVSTLWLAQMIPEQRLWEIQNPGDHPQKVLQSRSFDNFAIIRCGVKGNDPKIKDAGKWALTTAIVHKPESDSLWNNVLEDLSSVSKMMIKYRKSEFWPKPSHVYNSVVWAEIREMEWLNGPGDTRSICYAEREILKKMGNRWKHGGIPQSKATQILALDRTWIE
jgi:hypothetical protein